MRFNKFYNFHVNFNDSKYARLVTSTHRGIEFRRNKFLRLISQRRRIPRASPEGGSRVPDRPEVPRARYPNLHRACTVPAPCSCATQPAGTRGVVVTRHYRVTRSSGRRYKLQRRPTCPFSPPPSLLRLANCRSRISDDHRRLSSALVVGIASIVIEIIRIRGDSPN